MVDLIQLVKEELQKERSKAIPCGRRIMQLEKWRKELVFGMPDRTGRKKPDVVLPNSFNQNKLDKLQRKRGKNVKYRLNYKLIFGEDYSRRRK